MSDEKINRRKSFLYRKLFQQESMELKPDELRVAQCLEKEKMVSIKGKYVRLRGDCDLPYAQQKELNEKRYKTFIKAYQMDDNGRLSLVHKLIMPFHQDIYDARERFFAKFPFAQESSLFFIEIIYADIVLKEYDTIYYQNIR